MKKIDSLKICLSKKIGLKPSFKDRDRCGLTDRRPITSRCN